MQDWSGESLRRALICGAIVFIALSTNDWRFQVALFVVLIVFMLFLVRNPDGWARRLSYICIMTAVGMLMPLGSAVKATGWFEAKGRFSDAEWLAGVVVQIDENSPWLGVLFVVAGVMFGGIQVWRERGTDPSKKANNIPLRSKAKSSGDYVQQAAFTVPVKNGRDYNISIRKARVEPRRLVDRLLLRKTQVADIFSLEEDGKNTHEVYLPATLRKKEWKRFGLRVNVTNRWSQPRRLATKFIFWLFGVRRHYIRLYFEENEGDKTFKKILVIIG